MARDADSFQDSWNSGQWEAGPILKDSSEQVCARKLETLGQMIPPSFPFPETVGTDRRYAQYLEPGRIFIGGMLVL